MTRDRGDNRPARAWLKLRGKLFLGSALLASTILVIAAWVINDQVVAQAREQVRAEVKALLPVYEAVWDEHARGLATLGRTMADSPVVKTIFGDPRASRDRETIRELVAGFGPELSARVDLIVICDGAGKVLFAELDGGATLEVGELAAARDAALGQTQKQGCALLGGRPFQMVLTPVVLHSGSAGQNYTLAVLGTGAELNREIAREIRQRAGSDVVFRVGGRCSASSLAPEAEAGLCAALSERPPGRAAPEEPVEVRAGGAPSFAFARPLLGFDGARLGEVVLLRSLADANRLFRNISNLLLLLWTLSIGAAFLLSYFVARRITRPIEALAAGARELGRGNYDYRLPADARDEIGQLARAFDQMRRSLRETQSELLKRERLATIGQMASSIIHDLRNPLAAIETAAEMLGRDGLEPARRVALLRSQARASQRMSAMLKELLEFSRGSYSLKREPHSLAALVARVLEEQGPAAAAALVEVEARIEAGLPVQVDVGRLRRVLENLCANALQAMPGGGRLAVSAGTRGARARVEVRDTGPGVPAAIREHLFEPFISHGKPGGTGLGLAIARSIVEAHGGEIGLDAAAGGGAAFYFELPLDSLDSDSHGEVP